MTDRELLEAAAKAAGIEFIPSGPMNQTAALLLTDLKTLWNPLDNDAQALRLAVKLSISVTPYPIYASPKHSVLAKVPSLDSSMTEVVELHEGDPYAATRRAITRAAAEIGKGMK